MELVKHHTNTTEFLQISFHHSFVNNESTNQNSPDDMIRNSGFKIAIILFYNLIN